MGIKRFAFGWKAEKPKDLVGRFRGLGFGECELTEETLKVRNVISRDLEKKPYRWVGFEFNKDAVVLEYSANSLGDKVVALKTLLAVAEICSDISEKDVCRFMAMELEAFTGLDTEKLELAHALDTYKTEAGEAKAVRRTLEKQLEAKALELSRLGEENAGLTRRIKALESISPALLQEELIEHLRESGGKINVPKFAVARKVNPTLVEEALDEMAKKGMVERIS